MNQFSGNFFVLSTFFICLAAAEVNYLYVTPDCYLLVKVLLYLFIIAHLLLATGLGTLIFLPISKLHTRSTAIFHFLVLIAVHIIGSVNIRKFVKSSKQVRKCQSDLLVKDILSKNAGTELGRKLGFANIKTVEQYQAIVPLTKYDYYQSYVDRIEKGEQNLLTADQVVKLCVSSGTTGKCKLLPLVSGAIKSIAFEYSFPISYRAILRRPFPYSLAPLKLFEIAYVPKWRYTESGLPIGPFSAVSDGKRPLLLSVPFATPDEAMAYMSEPAQSYIHWLFGLMDRDIKAMSCSFGGTLLVNFEFLQNNWRQLSDDIRNGRITNTHNIPTEIVDAVLQLPVFIADPVRADEIERECSRGFEGIVKRLWPSVDNIVTICTGAHAIYRNRLAWFAGKDVRLFSSFLGASEGIFGMPLSDAQDSNYTYTLLIRMTFFEFILESDIAKEDPKILLADQLEIGQRYEVVITSKNGFYRYRMGDIMRVVDFFNQIPVVEFCSRVGGILDLRGEKTSEDMVLAAVNVVVSKWKDCRELIDFTVTDCVTLETSQELPSSSQLYYTLFIEMDGISRQLNESEVAEFDEALGSINFPYKSMRSRDAISKPKIFVVRRGTFGELKRRILASNNAISNQYKTPRYQKRHEFVRFLVESAC